MLNLADGLWKHWRHNHDKVAEGSSPRSRTPLASATECPPARWHGPVTQFEALTNLPRQSSDALKVDPHLHRMLA